MKVPHKRRTLVRCSVCGDRHYPQNMPGIYKKSGLYYYCHKEECLERFYDDAGDPPMEEEA